MRSRKIRTRLDEKPNPGFSDGELRSKLTVHGIGRHAVSLLLADGHHPVRGAILDLRKQSSREPHFGAIELSGAAQATVN